MLSLDEANCKEWMAQMYTVTLKLRLQSLV